MQPGQLLCNRYQIERHLAGGGFGQTYLAIDTHLPSKQQVVVKLLKPVSTDPATLQVAKRLFDTEAETLEQLGKDNDRIPSLYAYFELGGEFYLVQEFIKGTTLTAELQNRKLSESETLKILQEILIGLSRVHQKDIIHRDLKPDNIIRRAEDSKLVLIDFGAVKQVRVATVTTPNPVMSRTIGIGTPGYMPTEQGMGKPKLASDVYAVGAIGIQCLTGIAPDLLLNEDSLSIKWQHLRQVDRAFATVLNKLTAPDFRNRYHSAVEALESISILLSPPPPRPPVQPKIVSPPQPPKSTPVQPQSKSTILSNPVKRRNFIKYLGFGGSGLIGILILKSLFEKSPSLPTADISSKPQQLPKLTRIKIISVKLNSKGEIVDRPSSTVDTFTEDLGNGIKLTMVKIPAGKFMMGSPNTEKERENEESPQHQVSIPGFYLAKTLVTQAVWQNIMGNNPSHFKGNDQLPVDSVSWLDAMDFCEKLSQKTGRAYRLPSEAEWEYACRAGTSTPFAFGETITPNVANYNGNFVYAGAAKGVYRSKTTPVGTFPANLFGLYDMHGNLWEWCLDEWADSYNGAPVDGSPRGNIISRDKNQQRLLRGGSWINDPRNCRSADRHRWSADFRDKSFGFRIVLPQDS